MKRTSFSVERFAQWGVFALLATPLLYSNSLLFPAMAPKLLWLFLMSEMTFFLCVWLWFEKPTTRPRISPLVSLFLMFLVVLTLSSLVGIYPMNSVWGSFETNVGLLVWAHLLLVLLSLLTVARLPGAWIRIAVASTVVGLVVCLLQVSSVFPETVLKGFNSGSTLGNSSFLGTYLLFEFFFAGYLWLSVSGWMKRLGMAGVAIFFIALLSTDAAAAMLAAVGGVVFFVALNLLAGQKRFIRIVGAFLLVALAIFFVGSSVLAFREGSVLHTWIVEHSTGSRFVVARIAWEAFLERPLLGWGPENFRYAFLSHFDPCFGGEYCGANVLFDRAHNVILDILVSVGLIGFFAYAALWIGLLINLWRAYKHQILSTPVVALVVSVLAAYFVQNLTVFDTAVSLLFFSFLYAFVASQEQDNKPSRRVPKSVPILATLALPLCLFLFVIEPFRGAVSVKPAATSLNAERRYESYKTAVTVSPLGRDVRRDFLGLQTANLLWRFDPVAQAQTVVELKPYFSREIVLAKQALRDTLEHSPNDLRGYLYLIKLLQAQGRLYDRGAWDEAYTILEEARTRNIDQKLFYWIEVALRLEQGDRAVALQIAQQAVELAPDHPATRRNRQWLDAYLELVASGTGTHARLSELLLQFYIE